MSQPIHSHTTSNVSWWPGEAPLTLWVLIRVIIFIILLMPRAAAARMLLSKHIHNLPLLPRRPALLHSQLPPPPPQRLRRLRWLLLLLLLLLLLIWRGISAGCAVSTADVAAASAGGITATTFAAIRTAAYAAAGLAAARLEERAKVGQSSIKLLAAAISQLHADGNGLLPWRGHVACGSRRQAAVAQRALHAQPG